ncbi:MAG: hypothetical protein WC477_05535 [Patescibacteria group bacterium]
MIINTIKAPRLKKHHIEFHAGERSPFIMRQHQMNAMSKGGRPEWLNRAHEQARRDAWFGSIGQKPDKIETRQETKADRVVAIVAESRIDLTVPNPLKERLKAVFVKTNTETKVYGETVGETMTRSRVIVLVFKKPQNGISGLPVTPAESRKLRKDGFTHLVITSFPEGARDHTDWKIGRYDESGWWVGFYKPKGGHAHDGEKGGEIVRDFNSELFILQFLYENDLLALYEVPLIASWGFLPKTDDARENENAAAAAIQTMFGRSERFHKEHTYHRARLLECFRDLYREGASDEDELEQKAQAAFVETVIGRTTLQRIDAGTFETRTYYLSDDDRIAYAIHNGSDGQYVVKINRASKSVDVGLTKRDLNGLELMSLYDDFLTSNRFRQVSHSEFRAYTSGVGLVNLAT